MYKNRDIPYFQTDQEELCANNILDIIMQHKKYSEKYLQNEQYYDGKHKILHKQQSDTSKPNNKVVFNFPEYTVDIRTGYFSGEPIVFTSNNDKQSIEIKNVLEYNDFQYINNELDIMSSIYGHAFMIVYVDEDANIRLGVDDPYNTLVIHDSTIEHNVVGALRYFEYNDVLTNQDMIKITLYTKTNICEYSGPAQSPKLINSYDNIFNEIPVIEFIENSSRCGSFEKHISIVDAIDSILSSTINEIEYFDNAYLHLKGVVNDLSELENIGEEVFSDMKNNRTLITLADGSASFVTKNINDTYIENTLNRLIDSYHKLTKTPALSDENFGNASGVSLAYKLFNLNKDMSQKESRWRKSLQKMLELITIYHNIKSMNFDYKDIKITFTRALPNNEAEQVELINKLHGIVSQKTLLSQLDFIEDPDSEIKEIQKEKERYINELDMYEKGEQS